MRGYQSYVVLIPFACVVMLNPAWAFCEGQLSAYEAAEESFIVEAQEVYNVDLSDSDFSLQEKNNFRTLRPRKLDRHAPIFELSNASIVPHQDMLTLLDVLSASVNPLFLRTRPIPEVFVTGADLSCCLSDIEQALIWKVKVENGQLSDDIVTGWQAQIAEITDDTSADNAHSDIRDEATEMLAELAEMREHETEPDKILALAKNEALLEASMGLYTAAVIIEENPDILIPFGEILNSGIIQDVVAISFLLGPISKERKLLNDKIDSIFDKSLDFGHVDF